MLYDVHIIASIYMTYSFSQKNGPNMVMPAVFDFASAYRNGERLPPQLFSQLRAKG